MRNLLAQTTDWLGTDQIKPPFGGDWDDPSAGVENFINRGFRLAFVVMGLFALLNFILAAYNFINAQGETKNIDKARKLLTNSIVGLLLMAITFIFAGLIGAVFFGSWDALLNLNDAISNTFQP